MLRFLFPYKVYPRSVDAMLLLLRLLFGCFMMWHGVSKIDNFSVLVENFPNPIGLGSRMSLYLAIFAEVICSAAVIVGAFYRLALIPLIFTMGVAVIVVHNGQSFAAKELALIFLVIFVLLFVMGAGRYSLDNMISVQIHGADTCTDMNHNCSSEHTAEPVTPHPQDSELPTDDAPRR
ncbi:MAG: DoxX family protein [Alistipes sp.]|nr:DoxX family protein [Alistipes sp.]